MAKSKCTAGLRQQLASRMTMCDALEAIQREMDGRAWTPATLDAIADIMRAAGYPIRDMGESTNGQ